MAKDLKIKGYLDNRVDLSDTQLSPMGQIINKVPEVSPEDYYKSKMPVDWLDMSFSDRVDFVTAITDDNFKNYVLKQDPKIKGYFKHLKHRGSYDKAFNLYVTLFSFPADTTTLETKTVVKNLITSLNKLGRGRLQYMEIIDPPIVEIRELK
jgi:hypothetical protein